VSTDPRAFSRNNQYLGIPGEKTKLYLELPAGEHERQICLLATLVINCLWETPLADCLVITKDKVLDPISRPNGRSRVPGNTTVGKKEGGRGARK
jgi:hypothetical protein